MKPMSWMIALCVLLPGLARADKVALPKQYVERMKAPQSEALEAAAGFMVAAQRDFKAPQPKDSLQATWPFEQGGRTAAPNAAGIVARALLEVHALTGHAPSRAAAEAWGRARLADVAADRPIFDPDIEALVALGKATRDEAYLKAARTAFDLRHSGASGREIVERLFLVRKGVPALIGFDAAGSMRAALAVGEAAKAQEMAQALADTQARWNVADSQGFFLTSRAAVLEVLASQRLDLPLRQALRKQVLESQGKDGSWGQRNTQATAYSVRALFTAGDTSAAASGVRFLRATQLKSGGWGTFNDFLPEPFVGETVYEVSADVALALARESAR